MVNTFRCILFFVAVQMIEEFAFARLPKESDLAALTELESATFDVKRDGTFTLDYEIRIHILSEAGREAHAVKNISFNSRASKFELVSAVTINDGIELKVDPSNIEIKEIGDAKAFDTTKETIISFPSVRVGSRIAFHYRLRFFEIPVENFFSTGLNIELQNIDVLKRKIRSVRPLFVSNHDEMGLLNVLSKKEGDYFLVEISNREKMRLGVVQEDNAFVQNSRLPYVIVSTKSEWSEFASEIIATQEKLLREPLPPLMKAIRDAAIVESPARRMAVVAGRLAQEFRYFGDWRRRNGGHIPRTLKEIEQTGYGDCKDLSLAVVAIARSMGLSADIAWIWRSDIFPDESFYRLPNDFGFNHAVARVEDGSVVWIDATNPVSIPGQNFSDIGQRPALVLKSSGAVLDHTPTLKSADSVTKIDLSVDMWAAMKEKEQVLYSFVGKLFQHGRAATRAEWALLSVPREQFQHETARWLARNERLESYDLQTPMEASRVVRDLTFSAKFTIADLGLQTTAGVGFPLLRSDTIDLLLVESRDRFSDIWLGAPALFEEEYRLQNASVIGNVKVGCDLKNEWVQMSRSVDSKKQSVIIKSRYEIMRSVIPNAAIRSKDFAVFQKQLRRCFNRSAVILSLHPAPTRKSN